MQHLSAISQFSHLTSAISQFSIGPVFWAQRANLLRTQPNSSLPTSASGALCIPVVCHRS